MRRFFILMILLLSSFVGAGAQQKTDSTYHWNLSLSESFVSAYQKKDYSSPNDHLTRVELSRFTAVADAIRSLSGVQLKDYGGVGGLKTVNLRSLGSEHTGVYIDGIQVDNAQNMQVDLGRFSLENIAYVDLYSAGKSAGIQSAKEYASANSIYLNSLRPDFSNGKRTNTRVGTKAGSFGSFVPSVTVEHQFSNSLSLRVLSELTTYDGKYKFHRSKYLTMPDGSIAGYDTVMTRSNAHLKSARVEAQLFSPAGTKSIWNIKAYLYDSERGLPGPVIRRLNQTTADRQWDRNLFVQGKYERSFGEDDRNVISFLGKASFDYLRYKTFPEIDPYAMPYDNKYSQSNVYGSFSYMRKLTQNLSLNEAVDLQYSYLDANTRGFVFPSRYSLWTASGFVWAPGKFDLSASVVYQIAYDTYSNPTSPTLEAFSKEDDTRESLTPTAKFSYRPFGNFSVVGFSKKSYRMPSFNDLYYTLIGNVNLRPETAWQNSLSVEDLLVLKNGLSIQPRIEIYYNHVTDKIIATPTSSQFRWSMYNIGNVHILGSDVKLSIRKEFSKDIQVQLLTKYSFQDAKDYSSSKSMIYKNQIPYVAKHSGSLTADLMFKGYWVSYVQTYSSKRWSTGANRDDYLIKPWTTSDVFISKEIHLKGEMSMEIGINLNNIMSFQYEFVQGYPMPGFNYMGHLSLRF